MNRHPKRTRRPAFTLAEMMVSMFIMVILMGGLTSALVVAAQTIPAGDSAPEQLIELHNLLDQIASEVKYAVTFTNPMKEDMTFSVADRSHGPVGDETIRYYWGGSSGGPLMRQYNSDAAVAVLEDVDVLEFNLVEGIRQDQQGNDTNVFTGATIFIRTKKDVQLEARISVQILNEPTTDGQQVIQQ